jgi:predicted transcriptional regulator of viral defense system
MVEAKLQTTLTSKVVCIDAETYEKLKSLLEELLSPKLVVTIEGQSTASEGTVSATPPLRELILGVMRPGEQYTISKVRELIKQKYGVDIKPSILGVKMWYLYKWGTLKRVDKGVYMLARVDKPVEIERSMEGAKSVILRVLEPGKLYTPEDVRAALKRRGIVVSMKTVYNALSELTKKGKLKRTTHGIYQVG